MTEDDDTPDSANTRALFEEQLARLTKRCDAAKILWVRHQLEDESPYVTLSLPCGREQRKLFLHSVSEIETLLSIDFESYTFLDGLVAICKYSAGTIEATLRSISPGAPRFVLSKLLSSPRQEGDDPPEPQLELTAPEHGAKITIGPESTALYALSGQSMGPRAYSVRIEGLSIAHHDQALSLLRRLTSALFFQMDMSHGIAFQLRVERRAVVGSTALRAKRDSIPIEFPKNEYDPAPISLYWYARSASGMPLLQYLAYYQVIEYYYPVYSQAEAKRRIRTIIKDPTFRTDRDADIARILGAIRVTGAGFGDERSQLRATVQECVDADQLRAFVGEAEARTAFLASKTDGLTDKKIPLVNKEADLRNDVADRIYDIRCRIVHTKGGAGGSDVQMLLPFSRQAEQLNHDIALVRFVARAVLIATSSPLRIDVGVG